MIKELLKFANGYRATAIRDMPGRRGTGWAASFMKDGKLLGEAADYADGGALRINFNDEKDRAELLAYAKTVYPQYDFEQDCLFLGEVVNYEIAIRDIKRSKRLMKADESDKDDNGIARNFDAWNLTDTPKNRAAILAKLPDTVFLNDEVKEW